MYRRSFNSLATTTSAILVCTLVLTDSSAEDRTATATNAADFCYVRDSAMSCTDLLGIEFGSDAIFCDECIEGQACSGQFVRANAELSQEQYEKNRAISIKMQRGRGKSNVIAHVILCGIKASCSATCTSKEVSGSRVPYCPISFSDAEILFFDLSGDCISPQHLPVEHQER